MRSCTVFASIFSNEKNNKPLVSGLFLKAALNQLFFTLFFFGCMTIRQNANAQEQPNLKNKQQHLASLDFNTALPSGKLPDAISSKTLLPAVAFAQPNRGWSLIDYRWKASNLAHRPLYFEQINAERYGYGHNPLFQPAISAAHFFGTLPTLPYQMATDSPFKTIYTLGHYRPGSCSVPWRRNYLPFNAKGGLTEAGVLAGMLLIIP